MEEFDIIKLNGKIATIKSKATDELYEVFASPEIEQMWNEQKENEEKENEEKREETLQKAIWADGATHKLIQLYKENINKFKSTKIRHDEVWKTIAQNLKENGFNFSTKQVIFKWKNLKKKYMQCVDNMGDKGSGESPLKFKFYDEIDEIFNDKPNVHPKALASSSKGLSASKDEPEPSRPKLLKVSTKNSDLLNFLKEKEARSEEARDKRHKEKLQLQREALEEFKNIFQNIGKNNTEGQNKG